MLPQVLLVPSTSSSPGVGTTLFPSPAVVSPPTPSPLQYYSRDLNVWDEGILGLVNHFCESMLQLGHNYLGDTLVYHNIIGYRSKIVHVSRGRYGEGRVSIVRGSERLEVPSYRICGHKGVCIMTS
ncbi:hypothetical protein SADUNF_Sadunf19G0053900 [Salix dunnii]|uniref:Uncharacterized protein n=1 Tax=Salix dunnii TaxID=1413687 RepID=A0A835J1X1_9ROSI|nr:hypothetical protein SADUNF_Sadunf19G0053900 [Salix dunnii]